MEGSGADHLSSKGSVKPEKIVYIWDMDETIILLKSLLNGSYAGGFNGTKDVQQGIEIGKRWEKHILQVCDDYFFYEQVENYNSPSLDALCEFDDGRDLTDYNFANDKLGPPSDDINKRKLAYRYRVASKKYQQGLRNIVDPDMIREWNELYELTDKYTDRWLSSARSFLEQCSGVKETDIEAQHINILVTSGSLIPSLVKCILFQLDDLFSQNNVYSSWEVGKYHCFEQIKERFDGPNVRFCVIGDGWEECEAAQLLKWPFIQIDLDLGSSHKFPGDLASYDVRRGKLLGCFLGKCSGSIRSIARHPEFPIIASRGLDSYLRICNIRTRQLLSAVFLKQHLTSVVVDSNFTIKVTPQANEVQNTKGIDGDEEEEEDVAPKKRKRLERKSLKP